VTTEVMSAERGLTTRDDVFIVLKVLLDEFFLASARTLPSSRFPTDPAESLTYFSPLPLPHNRTRRRRTWATGVCGATLGVKVPGTWPRSLAFARRPKLTGRIFHDASAREVLTRPPEGFASRTGATGIGRDGCPPPRGP
jgi:hypothetical protein